MDKRLLNLADCMQLCEPKSSQEYMNLDAMHKFTLQMKWCQTGELNNKLKRFEKPLIIKKYYVINEVGVSKEFNNLTDVARFIGVKDISYQKFRYKDTKVLHTYINNYRLEKHTYLLNGDDYIDTIEKE